MKVRQRRHGNKETGKKGSRKLEREKQKKERNAIPVEVRVLESIATTNKTLG